MPEYMAAWQTFRDHSDEDRATVIHLLNSSSWPNRGSLVICDIGCGDGRIIEKILLNDFIKMHVHEVRLVDPDGDLLAQAKKSVDRTQKVRQVVPLKKYARDVWPSCAVGADVVLAIHVAYLMPNGELSRLLAERPKSTSLLVVLDSPDSVFTELWAETAPKYYQRVIKAHDTLSRYLGADAPKRTSFITARIPRVILRQRHHADWVLSILCYRNMRKGVDRQIRHKVDTILEKHMDSTGENIVCKSVCYEIPKQAV